MILSKSYFVDTTKGVDLINIVHEVRRTLKESNAENGTMTVSLPGPGAALSIMEKTDQEGGVKKGLEGLVANELTKEIVRCLLPKSLVIPVEKGKMVIEPWQDVFLIDYEKSGRRREFRVQVFYEEKPKGGNEPHQPQR